jgi:hypothetical protein
MPTPCRSSSISILRSFAQQSLPSQVSTHSQICNFLSLSTINYLSSSICQHIFRKRFAHGRLNQVTLQMSRHMSSKISSDQQGPQGPDTV